MLQASPNQNRSTHVTINTAALQHNLMQVKTIAPKAKVMAVIKADGYGHGMEVAAESLAQADEFAVNSLDDVIRLRNHGFDKPITILSPLLSSEQYATLPVLNVRPVIHDWQQFDALQQLASSVDLSVWVKIDTGMGRLGFKPTELNAVMQKLEACEAISAISLMTHLANADQALDSLNQQQITQFNKLCADYEFDQKSILNSAGVLNFPESAFDLVRPGVMLYGICPLLDATSLDIELKPVMSFKSCLLAIKTLDVGHAVGYGSTFVCSKPTTIGVVACGYGDGYPRHAKQGMPVLVNGMLTELIGRVSMDMLTVDLTGMKAQVGDQVELWGDNLPVETVAQSADTIAYELICGITSRVHRVIV